MSVHARPRDDESVYETNKDPADMEALAAMEHESWSGWTSYMLERQRSELEAALADDPLLRPLMSAFGNLPCVQRWQRQLATPYASLPASEKESDRIEARKKLLVYRPALARPTREEQLESALRSLFETHPPLPDFCRAEVAKLIRWGEEEA